MDKKYLRVLVISIVIIIVNMMAYYMGTSQTSLFKAVPISWSFASVGLTSFFGIYLITLILEEGHSSEKIKNAIAGSLLIVYFVLMSVYIFDEVVTLETTETKLIIENFTKLMSIVILSYFGTSAMDIYFSKKKAV